MKVVAMTISRLTKGKGSGGGRVVKLLACGVRGPGFGSSPRHLNFRDWLSPASNLQVAIWLKYR